MLLRQSLCRLFVVLLMLLLVLKFLVLKLVRFFTGDFKITERKMRGIVSYGMLCSGTEIGYPSDVDGLLLLDENAPVGLDIREYLDLNDSIVEFKITQIVEIAYPIAD